LLRLRVVQSELTAGARAREAGRLDEAQAILEGALQSAPSSSAVLRELAAVETARGNLGAAEDHAQNAVQLDGTDAESLAVLAACSRREEDTRKRRIHRRRPSIRGRPAAEGR
jgi:Flp pilus assembly protein TadD